MRRSKRFRDHSPAGKATAVGLIGLSAAIVVSAERDLWSRPQDELRGAKRLWQLACLNALGALAYFRWGRR